MAILAPENGTRTTLTPDPRVPATSVLSAPFLAGSAAAVGVAAFLRRQAEAALAARVAPPVVPPAVPRVVPPPPSIPRVTPPAVIPPLPPRPPSPTPSSRSSASPVAAGAGGLFMLLMVVGALLSGRRR